VAIHIQTAAAIPCGDSQYWAGPWEATVWRDASARATSRTGSRLAFVRETAGVDNPTHFRLDLDALGKAKRAPGLRYFASSRGTGEPPIFSGKAAICRK
jgi:hypothetical protein